MFIWGKEKAIDSEVDLFVLAVNQILIYRFGTIKIKYYRYVIGTDIATIIPLLIFHMFMLEFNLMQPLILYCTAKYPSILRNYTRLL